MMILDFNPAALGGPAYVLRVPRGEADPATLMTEYGLDLSEPATTHREAVMFTREPYAAASFHQYASPAARRQLGYIVEQVEKSWAPSSSRHIDVPPDKELWPFQRASVDYVMSRPHALVGDEPGLGKTEIAIATANEMKAKRVLVVCPASIRFQWIERIREWSTMGISYKVPNSVVYAVTSSKYGVHDEAAWTVISWDLIRNPALWRALTKTEYDLLIIDEAHNAKTIDTKRTQSLFGGSLTPVADPIASRCKKILALTGTPLPNRPAEAYTLSKHLCWEAIDWMGAEAFMDRFNPKQEKRTGTGRVYAVDERTGRLPELQNRLRANFMVRHLKRDVMTQLQFPEYDIIRVEETVSVKAALQAESMLGIDPETMLDGASIQILGEVSTARLQMGVAMAPQIVQYVKMLIDGGEEKLVVFAWHKEVVSMLVAGLSMHGAVKVDGSDSAKSKASKVKRFIEDPACKVIIGNVLTLGTGVDGLQQVSTHALIAEPDWVPGNNQQCADRLDRGGQKGKVQVDFFVAPGSLSEKVLATSLVKANTMHRALDRRVA